MKASQIHTSLELLVALKQPVFLWGPPGVGKSEIVKQTAEKQRLDLIDIRAILLDPVDLRGLPRISADGLSEWCTPSFFPQSGKGILFLDELNAAPPLVQASCYQLVLDRRLGEYSLPDGWSIIAAGNRERDRAVTHRMPSALANRFVHINFSVDCDEWLKWAVKREISPVIISFLRFRPALLHDFDPEKDSKAFPSPRTWEFASNLLKSIKNNKCLDSIDRTSTRTFTKSNGNIKTLHELLVGTIGKGAATELAGFMKIWHELPEVVEILRQPAQINLPTDPAVLFAVCEMVGRAANQKTADKIMIFANRLPDEFSVLLVREAIRHCNDIAQTDSFATWAAQHADVLL